MTTTAKPQVLFTASCVNGVIKQYMSVKLGYHCMKEWWSTFRTFVIENKIRYQNILQMMVILLNNYQVIIIEKNYGSETARLTKESFWIKKLKTLQHEWTEHTIWFDLGDKWHWTFKI